MDVYMSRKTFKLPFLASLILVFFQNCKKDPVVPVEDSKYYMQYQVLVRDSTLQQVIVDTRTVLDNAVKTKLEYTSNMQYTYKPHYDTISIVPEYKVLMAVPGIWKCGFSSNLIQRKWGIVNMFLEPTRLKVRAMHSLVEMA